LKIDNNRTIRLAARVATDAGGSAVSPLKESMQSVETKNNQQGIGSPDSQFLVFILAFAAGATVANIYYAQPLLDMISKHFQAGAGVTSLVSIATQLGYASGLLLIVPLGDSYERRGLIVSSIVATAFVLLAFAFSPSLPIMIAASYLLGVTSCTPQLIVPYAAGTAPIETRGRVVGSVMSGLLVGILFSRSISGFIAAHTGWQTVFFLASGGMLILAFLLRLRLPTQHPERRIPYPVLLKSMWPIIRDQPVLRKHSLIGALGFGAFGAFWTTLSFYLSSRPEHFDSQASGLFGLIGVAGALAAPVAGRLSDRLSAKIVNGVALGLVLISFGVMALANFNLIWLVIGVFLMDAGVQGSQLSNQVRIFALSPELRNRINGIYIFFYFIGGAAGALLGSFTWERWGWPGLCATGAALSLAAIAVLFARRRGGFKQVRCQA
jgi:predicted MFS family arabinose efflux permease